MEIHAFSDASQDGYGAVVYFRIKADTGWKTVFVAAKSRAAPIQRVTIPRMEVLSCLLAVRLVTSIIFYLDLKSSNFKKLFWSDSTCALSWIKSDPYLLKEFVGNRVTEIQNYSEPSEWHHVRSADNPADLISRGTYAHDLVQNPMWLQGPGWLANDLNFGDGPEKFNKNEHVHFKSETKAASLVCLATNNLNINFSNYSTFERLVKVMAFVLRFAYNCRHQERRSGDLSVYEYQNAELKVIFLEQRNHFSDEITKLMQKKPVAKGSPLASLNPFLDNEGFVRVRPNRSDYCYKLAYNSKYPIVLPDGVVSKLLVESQHEFLKHAGPQHTLNSLRDKYWLINARRIANRVHKFCIVCQRHDSRPIAQPSCPLPSARVSEAPPFTCVGLDFAGPLKCGDFPDQEFNFLLITCAATRAVHLELVDSLGVEDFFLAFRKFCSIRGMPSIIYSDNAQTFISSHKRLRRIFSTHSPQWRFIPPLSPWVGGWWERMVKSVKISLRKSLGHTTLKREELQTVLYEIAAIINSRPLTYASDNLADTQALTPNHFLIGRVTGSQPNISLVDTSPITARDLRLAYNLQQSSLQYYWEIWHSEYIRNLRPTFSCTRQIQKLAVGDLVLMRSSDNQIKSKRLNWPLARIVKVHKSRDGIIRCVDVRNSEGEIYKRSVQTLHLLEMDSDESEIEEQVEEQVEAEPHVTPYDDRVNNSDSNIPDSVNDSSLNNSNIDFSGFLDPASDSVSEDPLHISSPEGPSLGPNARDVNDPVEVGSIQQDQTEAGPMAEHGQDAQPIHRGNSNVVKTRSGRVSKPRERLDL